MSLVESNTKRKKCDKDIIVIEKKYMQIIELNNAMITKNPKHLDGLHSRVKVTENRLCEVEVRSI